MIKKLLLAGAALSLALYTPAYAQNVLPAVQGPNGPVMADPVVNIGYDSGTGLPCVVGKTATCSLQGAGGGGGGNLSVNASAAPTPVSAGAQALNEGLFSNLFTSLVDPVSGTAIALLDTANSGTLNSATLNLAYTVPLNANGAVSFKVSSLTGTGATLAVEASNDGGTTYTAVNGVLPVTGNFVTTLTTDQQFRVNAGDWDHVRLRVSVAGAGTVSITSLSSGTQPLVALSSPLPPGTNAIGSVTLQANTTGGVTTVSKQVANNTTSVAICASACTYYGAYVQTISATPLWLKLYNTAQGSVTCGSGTPVDRILIPANTTGAGAVIPIAGGVGAAYGTALTSCVTTGYADSDTTAPAANATQISFYVK